MPTKAEEYRAKAEECERLAAHITFEPAKQDMLRVAKQWRQLAEQAERHGW